MAPAMSSQPVLARQQGNGLAAGEGLYGLVLGPVQGLLGNGVPDQGRELLRRRGGLLQGEEGVVLIHRGEVRGRRVLHAAQAHGAPQDGVEQVHQAVLPVEHQPGRPLVLKLLLGVGKVLPNAAVDQALLLPWLNSSNQSLR